MSSPGATRVDPDSRVLTGFSADYADAFRIVAVPGHRARDWAARSLRGAEAGRGIFARSVWHGILGFDLAEFGTAGTLVGWRIAVDDADGLILDTDGRLMAGRMVFQTSDTHVTWTTMLRFHSRSARPIWTVAGHAHRRLAPRCLEAAHRSLQRSAHVG